MEKKQPDLDPCSFNDSEGAEWQLRFNLGIVEDLRDGLKFDFADLQSGKAFMMLSQDVTLFGRLLWMLCEKQAVVLGVEDRAFAERIGDDALDPAFKAMQGAIVNFTRKSFKDGVREMLNQAGGLTDQAGKVMKELAIEGGALAKTELQKEVAKFKASGKL